MATALEVLQAIDQHGSEFDSRAIAQRMDKDERRVRTAIHWLEIRGYVRCIREETRCYCRGEKGIHIYEMTSAGKLCLHPELETDYSVLMRVFCGL